MNQNVSQIALVNRLKFKHLAVLVALDDARNCRNMHRNGSDELRVGGDLTRFLAQGARPLERRPRSGTQIARDLQCQPRSTPDRCGFREKR